MEFVALLSLVLSLLFAVLGFVLFYFIVRAAVVNGLRQSRREQYMEDFLPEKATWLTVRQRQELRELANRVRPGVDMRDV